MRSTPVYDLVRSGRYNKRKHEVFELVVNEAEVDLFVGENEKKLLELIDLSPIAPDEVYLKPALLKTKPN